MLRGGGVAHGPHPRDFSSDLPRKMYDLAWRTALSYRYRKGELVVLGAMEDLSSAEPRWVEQVFDKVRFGKADGRSLIVTRGGEGVMPNLHAALAGAGGTGIAKRVGEVDVKDLLEMGRIVIEREMLERIFREHCSDVDGRVRTAVGI